MDGGQVPTMVTSNSQIINKGYADNALFAGYSQKIDKESSLGASFKAIQQNFTSDKNSYVLDVSYYKSFGFVDMGLVVENILALDSEDKPIVRFGGNYQQEKFKIASDLIYFNAYNSCYINFGVSYQILNGLSFSGGYSSYDEKLFVGSSLQTKVYKVDYVFFDSDLGATHQFGISFSL